MEEHEVSVNSFECVAILFSLRTIFFFLVLSLNNDGHHGVVGQWFKADVWIGNGWSWWTAYRV